MSFFKKNPLLTLTLIALILVGVPASVYIAQQQQEVRSRAATTQLLKIRVTGNNPDCTYVFAKDSSGNNRYIGAQSTPYVLCPSQGYVSYSGPNQIGPVTVTGAPKPDYTLTYTAGGSGVACSASGCYVDMPTGSGKDGTITIDYTKGSTAIPAAPTGLGASCSSETNCTVSWTKVSGVFYRLFVYKVGTTSNPVVNLNSANSPHSFTATPNTEYLWYVYACNDADNNDRVGCSAQTNGANFSSSGPTPTLAIGNSLFNLTVFLHGIGNSGDNSTNLFSGSNKDPMHKTLATKAYIMDQNNKLVTTATGNIIYDSAKGGYVGEVKTPEPVPSGSYTVRIEVPYHLVRLVKGIFPSTLPQAIPHLIAGDANSDNKLDIRDYNLLLTCYTSDPTTFPPSSSCTDAIKLATDFNDDGKVNSTDYLLYQRELSVQSGD